MFIVVCKKSFHDKLNTLWRDFLWVDSQKFKKVLYCSHWKIAMVRNSSNIDAQNSLQTIVDEINQK